jgi:hypothetical protein
VLGTRAMAGWGKSKRSLLVSFGADSRVLSVALIGYLTDSVIRSSALRGYEFAMLSLDWEYSLHEHSNCLPVSGPKGLVVIEQARSVQFRKGYLSDKKFVPISSHCQHPRRNRKATVRWIYALKERNISLASPSRTFDKNSRCAF